MNIRCTQFVREDGMTLMELSLNNRWFIRQQGGSVMVWHPTLNKWVHHASLINQEDRMDLEPVSMTLEQGLALLSNPNFKLS